MSTDKKSGVYQPDWGDLTANTVAGCPRDCKACYAKDGAIRYGRRDSENWKNETINKVLSEPVSYYNGKRFMYPTTHDISFDLISFHVRHLKKLLKPGNPVLIVSKPDFVCIERLCSDLEGHKDQIEFRFTIGSTDNSILEFWEPYASTFEERLRSLKYAFDNGFSTSVSAEPMWDMGIDNLVSSVHEYTTNGVWLGLLNKGKSRCKINGHGDVDTLQRVKDLEEYYSVERLQEIYDKYKESTFVRWKESILKKIGVAYG